MGESYCVNQMKKLVKDPHQTSEVSTALEQSRAAFWSVGFFSLFINLLMLTGPLFMLQIYDRVLTSKSHPTLIALIVLVGGLFLFLGLLEFIRIRILARIGEQFANNLGQKAMRATIEHTVNQTPNMGISPIRDMETIKQFIAGPGPSTLFDLPWTPIYLAVNFMLHWILGLFSVAATLILILIAILNELTSRKLSEKALHASTTSERAAEEARRNAEVITAMGMQQNIEQRWQFIQQQAQTAMLALSNRASIFTSMSKSVRMFLQSLVLAVGALLAINQLISPGAMIAASIILTRALAPIDQSIAGWRSFLNARKSYQRLSHILENVHQETDPMPLPAPKGKVEVEELYLAPPGSRTPLLQGLQFSINPGEALGILGQSGAGKSSLARTLAGIWVPQKGDVRLDGASLSQWSKAQLGAAIGYLPQSVDLHAGTVKENIARLNPDADPNEIIKAAVNAEVHNLILSLPKGYDTELGPGGLSLSGGQKQRIGLARAFFGNPALLILDEPNSNLDQEGEEALFNALTGAKKNGQTIIIIAHRPSAIKIVDKLLYLKEGRQSAFGPRDEILSKILARPVNPATNHIKTPITAT